jgi:hypothetical protein
MTKDVADHSWYDHLQPAVENALDLAEERVTGLPPALSLLHRRFLTYLDGKAVTGGWRRLAGNLNLFPLLPLQLWLAEALGLRDDPRIPQIAAASWLGYCSVRVTDDAMDEPGEDTLERLLLADLYLLRFVSGLRDVFGVDTIFWDAFHDRWDRYSEATASARSRPLEAAAGETEVRELGERFAPAVIPLEAIARLASREELLGDLESTVLHLGTSIQLMNDLLGLAEDARHGRWTAATAWSRGLGAGAASMEPRALWKRALQEPRIRSLPSKAIDEQRRAWSAASRRLSWPAGTRAYFDQREAWMTNLAASLDLLARGGASAVPETSGGLGGCSR